MDPWIWDGLNDGALQSMSITKDGSLETFSQLQADEGFDFGTCDNHGPGLNYQKQRAESVDHTMSSAPSQHQPTSDTPQRLSPAPLSQIDCSMDDLDVIMLQIDQEKFVTDNSLSWPPGPSIDAVVRFDVTTGAAVQTEPEATWDISGSQQLAWEPPVRECTTAGPEPPQGMGCADYGRSGAEFEAKPQQQLHSITRSGYNIQPQSLCVTKEPQVFYQARSDGICESSPYVILEVQEPLLPQPQLTTEPAESLDDLDFLMQTQQPQQQEAFPSVLIGTDPATYQLLEMGEFVAGNIMQTQQPQQQEAFPSVLIGTDPATYQLLEMESIDRETSRQQMQLQQLQQNQAHASWVLHGTDPVAQRFSAMSETDVDLIEELMRSDSPEAPNTKERQAAKGERKKRREAQLDPRDPELDRKAQLVLDNIKRFQMALGKPKGSIRVNHVTFAFLLDQRFARTMSFCSEDGVATDQIGPHFMVHDTRAVGDIYQVLKGNCNSHFDTYARAVRASRKRKTGLFDYLDPGKGARKRIFKLGPDGLKELKELKKALQPSFPP